MYPMIIEIGPQFFTDILLLNFTISLKNKQLATLKVVRLTRITLRDFK